MRKLTYAEYERLTARQRALLDAQLRRNEERIKRLAPLQEPTPWEVLDREAAAADRRGKRPAQQGANQRQRG